jgi:hypothetical protein
MHTKLLSSTVANTDQISAYREQLVIVVLFDKADPVFWELKLYFERPSDEIRFLNVTLCCCPLDLAMLNAEHDASDFWQQWAVTF